MAILAIEVPHQTARLFSEIDVPGTREPLSSMHITLVYLGDDIPIDVLAEAVKAVYAVSAKTRPFTVRASRVASFPINPDQKESHPVIARIDSDELHQMRQEIVEALDGADVGFDNKFPDYKPHVTLAYAPDAVEEFRIPSIEWGAHEIVMWGGDEGDSRLKVTFPLALQGRAAALARRVASRFMSGADSRGSATSRG